MSCYNVCVFFEIVLKTTFTSAKKNLFTYLLTYLLTYTYLFSCFFFLNNFYLMGAISLGHISFSGALEPRLSKQCRVS